MPSTFSQNLRIELIGSGEQAGLWGGSTNNNLGTLIEQAITGNTTIDVTAGSVVLTSLNGVSDQARSAVLTVTGTPGTTRVLTIPNVSKTYTVRNQSDSSVQIKTSSGSAYTMPTASQAQIYCTGSNVVTGRTITDNGDILISAPNPSSVAQGLGIAPTASPTFTGTPVAPTANIGTNTTQLATTEFVQTALQAVYPVGSVYINASVITSPATLLGFGTWAEIGAGRVLVGQDVGDTAFDVMGETGGSKDAIVVEHNHTGTTGNQSADHTHTFSGSGSSSIEGNHSHTINDSGHIHTQTWGQGGGGAFVGNGLVSTSVLQNANTTLSATTGISINNNGSHSHTISVSGTVGDNSVNHNHDFTTSTEGSSATNANLQPYVVVKMWQRTA